MKVSLKEEYKGQLGLEFNPLTSECKYILTQYAYPRFEAEIVEIEEGDELTVRSPHDGSIVIHRVVEFDYDSNLQMNINTGVYHQLIAGHPVSGIPPNIEPTYWFNLFTQGYPADLIKKV